MATSDESQPLWMIVSGLEREGAQAWYHAYGGCEAFETALANEVLALETTVERLPGGNVSVTVSVRGKRPAANLVTFFKLQRAGNRHFRRLEPPSSPT